MFEHLQKIDAKLYERYLTLERNVKSASNSFYDAYLDLQEQFVKHVAVFCEFDVKARETCGDLLNREDVRRFFLDVLREDKYVYEKMQDYTLKVNAHKHKGEKNIQVDTVVNYMRVIYNATTGFAKYVKVDVTEFNADFYIALFGLYEKENTALKNETARLKDELMVSIESGKMKDSDVAEFKGLLSQSEIEKLDLEEQNHALHTQVSKLKDIKLSSMEEKLNRTLELLTELSGSVIENRAISYAVGDTICGRERFQKYVDDAKEIFIKTKEGIDKINDKIETGANIVKEINRITSFIVKEGNVE